MKKILFLMTLITTQIVFAHHAQFNSPTPIIAQSFGLWTEQGQDWKDKMGDEVPLNKLNRLYIAFGEISRGRDHHHYIKLGKNAAHLRELVAYMRRINPAAQLFMTLNGDSSLRSFGGAADDKYFVANVLDFLQQYDLDGIDVAWEFNIDKSKLTMLLKTLYKTLHPAGYLLTLDAWQFVSPGYDIHAIRNYLDQINIMSYGTGISLSVCVSDYLKAGFPVRKMIGGIETEIDFNQFGGVVDSLGINGTIQAKAQYARDVGLAGMAAWRLDNDYASKHNGLHPTYQGAHELWRTMTA